MFERILTVCTGNICRSPLAEALIRTQLASAGRGASAQVRSAGTQAALGRPVDETVLFIARGQPQLLNLLEAHRSQPLSPTLTWWADLILVMDHAHAARIAKLDPLAACKVRLLGHWIGQQIPDPYLKHELDYRATHILVETAVSSWRNRINQ